MDAVDGISAAYYLIIIVPVLLLLHHWIGSRSLRHIPTVGGPSAPLLSYIGTFKCLFRGQDIIQVGYDKYKGGVFKVPTLNKWLVIVSGAKMIDELRKFPDNYASSFDASLEVSGLKYMLDNRVYENPYHITVIRGQLTRQLAVLFPNVRDEIVDAFENVVPVSSNGWLEINTLAAMSQVVGRVSNRVFLGLPLCRNKGYLELVIKFITDVGKSRIWITLSPLMLKPFVAKMISRLDESVDMCLEYLRGTIDERLENMRTYGSDWPDKPNDMLQWLMEEELKNEHFDIRNLARMVLLANFVSIHTSSISITHALYHLAANPELLTPLREEIEAIIKQNGWTKLAMDKMRKLDSFMRESQRMNGIAAVSVMRKALQDLRFSDGTVVPAGTTLVAAATPTHLDEKIYPNATVFNPWRFSDMREEGKATKHQLVNTSVDYVSFGHGKHACAGRFFAANELKAMMAHIVLNYDVKFEREGVRPPNKWHGLSIIPDPSAKVLFRKRQM